MRDPSAVWNAFVALLGTADADDLDDCQRIAQLSYRYGAEVQNGGHLQYFLNSSGLHAEASVLALRSLGARSQADVLEGALSVWRARSRQDPTTTEEFVERAREAEFDAFDRRYYDSVPTVLDLLGRYLTEHEGSFIHDA